MNEETSACLNRAERDNRIEQLYLGRPGCGGGSSGSAKRAGSVDGGSTRAAGRTGTRSCASAWRSTRQSAAELARLIWTSGSTT